MTRQIEVDKKSADQVRSLIGFLRIGISEMSVEGRFMLAMEVSRLVRPEIDEIKRRQVKAEQDALSQVR